MSCQLLWVFFFLSCLLREIRSEPLPNPLVQFLHPPPPPPPQFVQGGQNPQIHPPNPPIIPTTFSHPKTTHFPIIPDKKTEETQSHNFHFQRKYGPPPPPPPPDAFSYNQNNHHHHSPYGPPPQNFAPIPHYHHKKPFKQISIFIAPPPPPQSQSIYSDDEKQLNIIFIKNPAYAQLKSEPEQKTVIYVLNEVPGSKKEKKVDKPEVFFVQYKDHNKDHKEPIYGTGGTNGHNQQPIYGTGGTNGLNFQHLQHFQHQDRPQFDYDQLSTTKHVPILNLNPQQSVNQNIQPRNDGNIHNFREFREHNKFDSFHMTNYAPTMSHTNYVVSKKRQVVVNEGESGTNSSSKSNDFRPYTYASGMDHRYYGVM